MKFYESKAAKFFAGKGFYWVLAVCMIVVGFAVYATVGISTPSREPIVDEYESDTPPTPVIPYNNAQQNVSSDNGTSSQEEAEPTNMEEMPPYFIVPVDGIVEKEFSYDTLQYSATYKDMRIHSGADIVPSNGTVIVAAADGEVINVEHDTVYGTVISIDHYDGVVLNYCGVKNVTVNKNDIVEKGEIIAEVGIVNNECADKDHLHLELLLDGEYADPMTLF